MQTGDPSEGFGLAVSLPAWPTLEASQHSPRRHPDPVPRPTGGLFLSQDPQWASRIWEIARTVNRRQALSSGSQPAVVCGSADVTGLFRRPHPHPHPAGGACKTAMPPSGTSPVPMSGRDYAL